MLDENSHGKGHNSQATNSDTVAGAKLLAFVERVERMRKERKSIGEDISEVFGEMKGEGYDVKIVKEVLKLREMDPGARHERDAVLDLYLNALGMV